MDIEVIERLLEIVAQSGMAEVEVEQDDFKVVVRAHPTTLPVTASTPPVAMVPATIAPAQTGEASVPTVSTPISQGGGEAATGTIVRAPIVGTFYSAPSPDADTFVKVGDHVEVGSVLCIIEAMKLMNEIQSEHAGVVKQILAENARPVEFDQPLFLIDES